MAVAQFPTKIRHFYAKIKMREGIRSTYSISQWETGEKCLKLSWNWCKLVAGDARRVGALLDCGVIYAIITNVAGKPSSLCPTIISVNSCVR